MAQYKFISDRIVLDTSTNTYIPIDFKDNRFTQEYLEWLKLGNIADAADPKPIPKKPLEAQLGEIPDGRIVTKQDSETLVAGKTLGKLTPL